MQNETSTIADRIRLTRQELGLTQNQLANYLSVSQAIISRWETNGPVTLSTITRVANVLHVEPSWLAFGTSPRRRSKALEPRGV